MGNHLIVYIHFLIEPSFGIDRIVYSVLLHSFCESDDKDYFKFNKSVAPVQVGVFPLVNKEGPREIAQNLTEELRMNGFRVEYDATGTIGKRYARADEIGIPLAITVDFDTLEDNQVTVRDLSLMKHQPSSLNNPNTITSSVKNFIHFL